MDTRRAALGVINLLGGIAVLGSYAHGILTHDSPGSALWGGVPAWLRPLYQVSMLTAAAGYLLFTYVLFFRVEPDAAQVGPFGYALLPGLYLLILGPAALWMPLTFGYLAAPGSGMWFLVRGVLFLTGAGAVAMVAALWGLTPLTTTLRTLAVTGALAFTLQTAVLDALVWPAFFRRP